MSQVRQAARRAQRLVAKNLAVTFLVAMTILLPQTGVPGLVRQIREGPVWTIRNCDDSKLRRFERANSRFPRPKTPWEACKSADLANRSSLSPKDGKDRLQLSAGD